MRLLSLAFLSVGVALMTGCSGAHRSAAPADLRIYDLTGHVRIEVTERDIVASSVKTWRGDGTTSINFELTRGQRSFLALTRGLAHRGAMLHRVQHFAIAVRGRIYSRPLIDYRLTPNGLDATTGVSIANVRPRMAERLADAVRGARR